MSLPSSFGHPAKQQPLWAAVSYTRKDNSPQNTPMQVFLVGTAVLELLQGQKPTQLNHVVVGATPEQLLNKGFYRAEHEPAVFWHKQTGALSFTLAQAQLPPDSSSPAPCELTHGPEVRLEDDLARRIVTIHAMAVRETFIEGLGPVGDAAPWYEGDHVIDPFGGSQDLEDRVLRHVRAETFLQDPIRVLRLARLAARYDFSVAPETLTLCQYLVRGGKLSSISPALVWKEIAKGLMTPTPSRMFEVLRQCGALAALMPELNALAGVPQVKEHHPEVDTFDHVMLALDLAAKEDASLDVRFAVLTHDLGKALTPKSAWPKHHAHEELGLPPVLSMASRLQVPGLCLDMARLTCVEHLRVHRALELNASSMVKLLMRADAIRRPSRLSNLLHACEMDARGRKGFSERPYPQKALLEKAAQAIRIIDTKKLLSPEGDVQLFLQKLHQARVTAVKAVLREHQQTHQEAVDAPAC